MKHPLKLTWELYMGEFEKVLVLMLTTTLPLLILHSFVTNYIYAITPRTTPIYSFADIYYGLITLLIFIYAQVPYIRFVYNEEEGNEYSLRNAIYIFFSNGFTVFVFACIVSILITAGLTLFIIPGLIILILFFPIPYISVFDGKSVWKAFKEGFRIGRKRFFKIALIILVSGVLELGLGILTTTQLIKITDLFAAQLITQMVLNLIFYPFIIFLVTFYIIKWRKSLQTLDVDNSRF
ncbi:hypothetical protein [Virgibacillus siamensis]|uniref:hypothetical protein n=1 Tax=Virgibacillus siamensis TaxID=480071 RepID=UPI0009860F8B|nr:hypothetical protein [Virgibacillus siamensis]